MKAKLIFVRHGDLVGERKDVLHTSDDQVYLSELGTKQMETIAESLKQYNPSEIYSSRERRTVNSALIIGNKLSVPTFQTEKLRGRNWGDFAGKTWEEVSKILSVLTIDERYVFVPPDGESWQQFENRILQTIIPIANQNIGKTIVIVSHGSTIRVLLPKMFGIPIEDSLNMYPDYGTLSIAEFENGEFTPVVFNSSSNIVH